MNLNNINQIDKIDFISSFENIFEESRFITEIVETKRPFKNKNHMITNFLMIFDDLEQDIKIMVTRKSFNNRLIIFAGKNNKISNNEIKKFFSVNNLLRLIIFKIIIEDLHLLEPYF